VRLYRWGKIKIAIKADKEIVVFAHELEGMDLDVFIHQWCGCGCGYYQIFAFWGDESVRCDVITRDEARHMYE
jgi:hypothetical protein